ncbi:putative PAT complex subunit CCDC47 protein [Helianthus annuus]|nr:putative PAT complex subunit CCDC47 protein [Helianthus annuus]
MATPRSPPFLSSFLSPRGDTLLYLIALLSIFSLLLHHLSADSHFEGFDADEDLEDDSVILQPPLSTLPRRSPPPPTTLSTSSDPESHHGPPVSDPVSDHVSKPYVATSSFEYWDEDEFEGIPVEITPPEVTDEAEAVANVAESVLVEADETVRVSEPISWTEMLRSYVIEIVCACFLIMFTVNYFTGKKKNEALALAWAAKFATRDTIFDKNFSLLGVGDGDGDDSPLLLKEGQNVFKFYASGRRFCQGLVATMELKSRHDLIARLFNVVVPCKDEISIEVYMNEEAMDHVVFALAKKKAAKVMQKEVRDLQRFANLMTSAPNGRKWVAEELGVITESKEVAGDLITETVLDQVFGEKAFEKFGKWFISMHFSDQQQSTHRKMLVFKFALPDVNHMADMTRLVALVPYYIDLIGRYKLSSQARSKTEAARTKVAQEVYKELQNARQEALQRKKAERRKLMEEAESKLNAEALRKREAKERSRQLKKAMPKMKMSRGA